MFSIGKYGHRKKGDRYMLPMDLSPNVVIDAMRMQQKKSISPYRIKQQIIQKISQQGRKVQRLKIKGTQMNNNFILPITKITKPKTVQTQKKKKCLHQQKQIQKNKLHQILLDTLQNIVKAISRDPDSHLYTKELEELNKYKILHKTQHTLKNSQTVSQNSPTASVKEDKGKEQYEQLIMANPILYKKVLLAYRKLQGQKTQKNSPQQKKNPTVSETLINRKANKTFKNKVVSSQKDLPFLQLKKLNNYIQYRQFLMVVNLSNKIIIFPQNEIQYKACICKGNNDLLVKSIIKTRPWWALRSQTDIDSCCLVWSEWKKNKLVNNIGCKLPTKEDKLERGSSINSNQCQRMEKEASQKQVSGIASQGLTKNLSTLNLKITQIGKLVNTQNFQIIKYLKNEQNESNYFTFTKKINQKYFEEISKNYLPAYQHYFSTTNRSKDKMIVMHNHLPGCLQLHSKKLLYLNMKKYYKNINKQILQNIPQTYVIKDGIEDQHFINFIQRFNYYQNQKNDHKNKNKNIWICKPGENSNRGNGITVVSTLDQIKQQIKHMKGFGRSLIIQKYIENPYLYNKRKFDIRAYLLITSVNGILKAYFFNESYIRTTSKQYNLKNLDNKFVHLTNDAIQKKGEQYGKFEKSNKVSFSQFEKYLQGIDIIQLNKFIQAKKRIKQIVIEMVYATAYKLNPDYKQFCFELFGLDFMLDAKMKPYLIQANSNPCLQAECSVLSKIIPSLIENVIRIAIDPIFPPPYCQNWRNSRFSPGNSFQLNKFEIIYDSQEDNNTKDRIIKNQDGNQLQQQQVQGLYEQQNQVQ